jgi:hypothetical protein
LLLDGRSGSDAVPSQGWLDPTVFELDAALAGLRTVDRVARERPSFGEAAEA